jgi:protein-S-isoprenylcysteine O-methyltransferase Ste14
MAPAQGNVVNAYDRIFGAGPRGTVISLALLALAWLLEPRLGLPSIAGNDWVRWTVFTLGCVGTVIILIWSVKSLPPSMRGKGLVTTGAFHYVRHPLYAAFLSCFNFGLAVLLDNWIYVAWAVLQHVVWYWNIRSEEALMRGVFPDAYPDYCAVTGRFVPRLKSLLG